MKIDNTKIKLPIDVQRKEQTSEQVLSQKFVQLSDDDLKKASQCVASLRMAEVSFKAIVDEVSERVSKNDLQKLVDEKKSVAEICEICSISVHQYKRLIKKYEIITPRKASKDNVSSIRKETLNALLAEGKTVNEICKILKINPSTYGNLLKRFDIKTNFQDIRENATNITKEALQEMLAKGKSPKEIANEFGVSTACCLNHLKKYGLKTERTIVKENIDSIKKEYFKSLIGSDKTVNEICSELNISHSTYGRLLHRFGLETSLRTSMKKNAEITKEQLQDVVDRDLPLKVACEELGISKSTYNVLLTKYGIKTKTMLHNERVNSITETQFRSLLESGLTADEIQKELQISTKFYYSLMNKFKIQVRKYDVKSNDNKLRKDIQSLLAQGVPIKDIVERLNITEDICRYIMKKLGCLSQREELNQRKSEITKEQLWEQLAKGKTVKENYQDLGLTESSYYSLLSKYGIKTELQKRKEELSKVTVGDVQLLLAENKNLSAICKELKICEETFYRILSYHNIQTERQKSLRRNKTISREVIVGLIKQGKTIKEICEELKISPAAYNHFKFLYNLTTPRKKVIAEKVYENYSIDELKEKLINLYIENDVVSQNNMLSTMVDYISYKMDFTEANKVDLIEFVKLVENVTKNKISIQELNFLPITKRISNEIDEQSKKEQERQEKFEVLLAQYYGVLENLLKSNMSQTIAIAYKYMPLDIEDQNVGFVKDVLDMVKTIFASEENSIEQLNKIKRNLIYMDAQKDLSLKNELCEATKYCQKQYGEYTPEQVGQYIENKRIYEKYLKTGEVSEYPSEFVEIIKEKTELFNDSIPHERAISYMIKLDNWFNSQMAENNYINDFLKIFSPDRLIDNALIQYFVETIYTKEDTKTVAIGQNGRNENAVIPAKTKHKIYTTHKYPNALQYFSEFEDALKRFAPPKGANGIKLENMGKKRLKLKVVSMPDRIFSTNKDFCFDYYSPTGDH